MAQPHSEHLSDEDLVMIFYDEPDASKAGRRHLAGCKECQENLAALTRTLRLTSDWQTPEPPPDFEQSVWARLAPELTENRPRFVMNLFRPRVWIPAAALALLVMAAFFAGRFSRPAPEPMTAGLSAKARERILVISLADHLERAGLLLTDLANGSDESDIQLTGFDRERARDMVSEGRLLEQALDSKQRGLSGAQVNMAMLDELERFLLEVANSPDRVTPASMREWRQRIHSDSLLFKVRVAETNLRTKGQKL